MKRGYATELRSGKGVSPQGAPGIRDTRHEFADNLYGNVFKIWANREVERRIAAGRVSANYQPWAVQVLLEPDAPTIIRFDEEAKGIVQVAKGVIESGKQTLSPVTFHEYAGNVLSFSLASDDSPNAGHITLIRHQKGFFISFDFRYNSARISDHLEAAREFLDVAETSLNGGKKRPFTADLYQAVELLAKASLLTIPAKGIVNSKSHGPIRTQYNLYLKGKVIEPRFAALFNRLDTLRSPARYPKVAFKLEEKEAKEMLRIANEMYAALLSRPPFQLHRTAEKADHLLAFPIDTPAE